MRYPWRNKGRSSAAATPDRTKSYEIIDNDTIQQPQQN